MTVESAINLTNFNSTESQQRRLSLLGIIAEVGDWSYIFNTLTMTWSEYLYDFYEVDKSFNCSKLLESEQFYRGHEKEKLQAMIERIQSTKSACTDEFMIVMGDGRFKWHTITIYPMLDDCGNLTGLYGVLQNISQKKQEEENKKKQHLLYNLILNRLPIELVVLNNNGNYIYANDAVLNSTECRDTPMRKSGDENHPEFGNLVPAIEGSWCQKVIKECMATKKVVTFEEKLNGVNGIERTYLRSMYPLLDENGNAEFLMGHSIDITARKKSELELQRMAYVAEKTNGIVMITDPDKKIIWVNNSFEKILGYGFEEVMGIDPADFLQGPETSLETIHEIAYSLKNTGTFSGEILNYTKNGEKIWLYLNIAAVHDNTGKLINYVAVENDITLIKMAEQRLQKAMEKERELNRFKTQFVSLASHQFRTPLATIRSSIDLLDLKMESANFNSLFVEFFRKHKAIMAEETMRMTELMENVLDIGRIDEGKIEISKKNISFKKFMDEFVHSNSEPNGQQRKLDYYFDAPEERMISMDAILIRNVLRNVVSNAFKYSEGKQPPELTVTFHDGIYFIAIKDYGIGIPEKDQPLLFQSFFRASNAKVFPGSGLGLMIAKKLILIHGGDIGFESQAGRGCTVTIQLPV